MSVYAVPPGANFAEVFARGLLARQAGQPAEALARLRILVNTRRSLRAIEDALAAAAPPPLLLPRLSLLSELGADPLAEPDLPPAIDPLRRRLHLIRLVERWLEATEGAAARAAAPDLAAALERLLDELDEEGVAADRLDGLVPEGLAGHWQGTLRFVDLIREVWPKVRAEEEARALDPKARQRAVIERLVDRWREHPPAEPVIAAASTGSVASTAELLAAIARLPNGMVVLPGFDQDLPEDIWACLAADPPGSPDQPMSPFVRLLRRLELRPEDVRPWTEVAAAAARSRLMTEALRPAPVTDAWAVAAPALADEAEAATQDLTLVEAENQRLEAGAIALAIRRGLEDPARRIALITPDATLARRVTAELGRFGIVPDDSFGKPLAQSPAAIFFRLAAEAAAPGAGPVAIAALLQHPMCHAGRSRAAHLAHARRYELEILRAKPEFDRAPGTLPHWDEPEGAAWLSDVEAALSPLGRAMAGGALTAIVEAHIAAAEALSSPAPEEPGTVWQGEDGQALRRFLGRLGVASDAVGPGPVADWPRLFASLVEGEQLRPDPVRPHPRVAIWGTMEARVQAADLVILGGLNEGIWPPAQSPDPWLSRPMRAALGLGAPEAAIGLSAHDFLQAVLKREVVLTRSTRIEGTPSVASRWLMRLSNLLGGLDEGKALAGMKARGAALVRLASLVHRPDRAADRAPPPAPVPPVEARPRKLSATQVERLVRDAYAIYAETVLKLKPLDPLGRPANFLDRGIVIHTILERFIAATRDGLPPDAAARELLLAIARDELAREVPWPDIRRIWLGRIARFADWFVEGEHSRRQAGQPAELEARGEITITVAGEPFRLTARADRIDTLDDGAAAIFDYKTGHPPSKNKIDAGLAHQLHLQAVILSAGGFAELPALAVDEGAYIGLTGAPPGGLETKAVNLTADRPTYLDRLAALLERYARPGTPYRSRGMVERIDDVGDYDHLARRWEWEGAEP